MTSARPLVASLGLAVLLVGAGGCDTLRARHRAQEGAELYKKQDFHGALCKYEQAVELDPSIDDLHWNLAFTYGQLYTDSPKSRAGQEYGGLAVKAFEEYLRRQPEDTVARNYLVQTFVDTNRYDDAVAYFQPVINKTPPDLEAISTLGQIAAKTNRMDKALEWYQRRVEINPKDADGPYNLGVLIWDYLHNHAEVVGVERLKLADRGIEALRQTIQLRPNAGDGWTYANLVYREKASGEPDDAHKAIDNAEAERYMKASLELKKPGAAAPPLPAAPVYPAETPDGGVPAPPPAKGHR